MRKYELFRNVTGELERATVYDVHQRPLKQSSHNDNDEVICNCSRNYSNQMSCERLERHTAYGLHEGELRNMTYTGHGIYRSIEAEWRSYTGIIERW